MVEALEKLPPGLEWAIALAIAWLVGEVGHAWLRLPRLSGYAIAGFFMASSQRGFLEPDAARTLAPVADVAFALIQFELGFRINFNWLRHNPWLGLTSIAEAAFSFGAVFAVAQAFGVGLVSSLLLASIAMASSPATGLRIANETRAGGQVTERMLHLAAFNCVLAFIAFKAVTGYWVLESAGSLLQAAWASVFVVLVSAGLGALFGVVVPWLLRALGAGANGFGASHATVLFAIAVLVLTMATHALKLSPLLAALVFGFVARHRRLVLSQAERNFGVLGDVLTIFLFVYVAFQVDWRNAVGHVGLAAAIVGARFAAKTAITTLLARATGVSFRKGALTGLALTPFSAFAVLLVGQSRQLDVAGLDVLDDLPGLAAMVLILEVCAPPIVKWALGRAGETAEADAARTGDRHAS